MTEAPKVGVPPAEPPATESPIAEVGPRRWREAVRSFDEWVDGRWEPLRTSAAADRVFYGASELGDFSVLWHLVGAVQGLQSDADFDRAVRLSATLAVESLLINGGIKSLFRRTRPVHEVERPLRLRQPRSSSFPSGHASAAACTATLMSRGGASTLAWWTAAAVVGTSRIHVRIHHASDVVAGAAVGTAIGLVARRLWPLPRPR